MHSNEKACPKTGLVCVQQFCNARKGRCAMKGEEKTVVEGYRPICPIMGELNTNINSPENGGRQTRPNTGVS